MGRGFPKDFCKTQILLKLTNCILFISFTTYTIHISFELLSGSAKAKKILLQLLVEVVIILKIHPPTQPSTHHIIDMRSSHLAV